MSRTRFARRAARWGRTFLVLGTLTAGAAVGQVLGGHPQPLPKPWTPPPIPIPRLPEVTGGTPSAGSRGAMPNCPPSSAPAVPAPPKPATPYRDLAGWETTLFEEGRELFNRTWTEKQGLGGPHFNGTSCATCHRDPAIGGAGGPEFDVPTSAYDPRGGHPNRRRPARPSTPSGGVIEASHQTPSLLGLGRIESIPDHVILANEDPDDLDGDGVRGVASLVQVGDRMEVGRFGWRAQAPTLADFVRAALGAEIGLTTDDAGRDFGLGKDKDRARDPELPNRDLEKLVYFVRMLSPPEMAEIVDDARHLRGKMLFAEVGCATCHIPTLQGAQGPVNLYSDLLLHAVSRPHDEQGTPVGKPAAFRTPPLWGIADTAPFMHDGRADTLRAAVELHDGEAARSVQRFTALDPEDQETLLAFVQAL